MKSRTHGRINATELKRGQKTEMEKMRNTTHTHTKIRDKKAKTEKTEWRRKNIIITMTDFYLVYDSVNISLNYVFGLAQENGYYKKKKTISFSLSLSHSRNEQTLN